MPTLNEMIQDCEWREYITAKINRKIVTCGECFVWTAHITKDGYGQERLAGKKYMTHRIVWMLYNGSIPENMNVLHTCDNPPCCNPRHLLLGTQADNIRDKVSKGRQAKGEGHGQSKLTSTSVLSIRKEHSEGASIGYLADLYGVSRDTIYKVVLRRSWTHV